MLKMLFVPLLLWGTCGMAAAGTELSQAAETEPPLQVERILAELPWRFDVSTTRQEAADRHSDSTAPEWTERTTYRFVSAEPYRSTAQGPLFLRAELTVERFPKATGAEQSFQSIWGRAHPDMGLSYAWDHLTLSGNAVWHLHTGCVFSEENFLQMVRGLEALVDPAEGGDTRSLQCRCGGGCRKWSTPTVR